MELQEKMLEYFGVQLSSCEVAFCVPPGNTLLAQASANETGAFLSMRKGPEGNKDNTIFFKLFEEDQDNASSIILVDEIDCLALREGNPFEAKRMVFCLSLHLDALTLLKVEFLVLDPPLEYFTMQLLEVKMEIEKLKLAQYKAVQVFIIFNEETSQRKCLESMCVGKIPAMLDTTDNINAKILFDGSLLAIKEASKTSNLEFGFQKHLQEQIISCWAALLSVSLVLAYFSIALLISFWNSVLPSLSKFLVKSFETHHTQDSLENKFIKKAFTACGLCSLLILYLVGLDHSSSMLSPYCIGSITKPLVRADVEVGSFFSALATS